MTGEHDDGHQNSLLTVYDMQRQCHHGNTPLLYVLHIMLLI